MIDLGPMEVGDGAPIQTVGKVGFQIGDRAVDVEAREVGIVRSPDRDRRTPESVATDRPVPGVLDPLTRETREWPSPSGPTSHPYAIAVIDDVIWYNESGMRPDALVRFDPKTERFQSWAIPSGVGIVRHVWVTRAGELLIHQTSSNRVGRVRILGEQD